MDSEWPDRIARAQRSAAAAGIDALLITPGADLRYLTGYDAVALERLTCLVLPAGGDPVLVVPALEEAAALASPVGDLGLDLLRWQETEDPYKLTGVLLPGARTVAVDDHMWAATVLALRAAMPGAEQVAAGSVMQELRMRKSPGEIESLRRAGAAIDAVHAHMTDMLRPGRTEREVATEVSEAILAAGHIRVDFVIVASGPNGASPHHEVSDRVLQAGDTVVVDIGGTMPDGYCSDSTRTYALDEPPELALRQYADLQAAQRAAVAQVRPGVTCASVDAAARDLLTDAGWGDLFIHRTGHGIGLETHEEPYIVTGNDRVLEPGMVFSVEPGVYQSGLHGARIEDIVVCTADGVLRCNTRPHDLMVVD